jgi:hypothetical protein
MHAERNAARKRKDDEGRRPGDTTQHVNAHMPRTLSGLQAE